MPKIFFQFTCLPNSHSCKIFQIFHTMDHFITTTEVSLTRKNYYKVWGKSTFNVSGCFLLFIDCYKWTSHFYAKPVWQEANPKTTRWTRWENIHSYLSFQTRLRYWFLQKAFPWFSAFSNRMNSSLHLPSAYHATLSFLLVSCVWVQHETMS